MIELFEIFSLLTLGFLLGLKHALDADHVVAITTLLTENKSIKKASSLGIFWGIGHMIPLLLIGLLVLSLGLTIPESFSYFFEALVGLMLILLGGNIFLTIYKKKMHIHKHKHLTNTPNPHLHVHLHTHDKNKPHKKHSHKHKSLVIGIFHGLAGSAALLFLILATINSVFLGILTILIFSLGTIIGMTIVSTLLAVPFVLTKKATKIYFIITLLSGILSIVLGAIILVSSLQSLS